MVIYIVKQISFKSPHLYESIDVELIDVVKVSAVRLRIAKLIRP